MWCSLQLMRGEWLMCWWLEGPDSLVHMQHCDSWKKATAWRLWYGNEKVIHISQDSLFSQSCRSDDPWQLMMIWRTWKKAMDPLLHLLVQNQVQRGVHFVVLSIRMKKHVWQLNGLWPQDNLSRGNLGAVEQLQKLFPEPGRLQFIFADLGDSKRVCFLSSFFLSTIFTKVILYLFIFPSFPGGIQQHFERDAEEWNFFLFDTSSSYAHIYIVFLRWKCDASFFEGNIPNPSQICFRTHSKPSKNWTWMTWHFNGNKINLWINVPSGSLLRLCHVSMTAAG